MMDYSIEKPAAVSSEITGACQCEKKLPESNCQLHYMPCGELAQVPTAWQAVSYLVSVKIAMEVA